MKDGQKGLRAGCPPAEWSDRLECPVRSRFDSAVGAPIRSYSFVAAMNATHLIHVVPPFENRSAAKEFGHDTPYGPHVDCT